MHTLRAVGARLVHAAFEDKDPRQHGLTATPVHLLMELNRALHHALQAHPSGARQTLAAIADARDARGLAPIHKAALPAEVRVLVNVFGAAVDAPVMYGREYGHSALAHAVETRTVLALLSAGAGAGAGAGADDAALAGELRGIVAAHLPALRAALPTYQGNMSETLWELARAAPSDAPFARPTTTTALASSWAALSEAFTRCLNANRNDGRWPREYRDLHLWLRAAYPQDTMRRMMLTRPTTMQRGAPLPPYPPAVAAALPPPIWEGVDLVPPLAYDVRTGRPMPPAQRRQTSPRISRG